jgi:membrane fusion protein (multidrug efflux system)
MPTPELSGKTAEASAAGVAAPAHDGAPHPEAKPVAPAIPVAAVPAPASAPPAGTLRRWALIAAAVVVVGASVVFGIPWIRHVLATVSTDDAYVNSHVTNVAPRVSGQVIRVLVDDNNRVAKGDLLVELDPEPHEVQRGIKQAALEAAEADLVSARYQVRGFVSQARGSRFKLEHAIEQVNNQVALLRANVATLESKKATLARAQADIERSRGLAAKGNISRQELDRDEEAYRVADAQVKQALEAVYQVRVSLGLPTEPPEGKELTDVPPNLNQNFSTVRQSLAEMLLSAAPLGIVPKSFDLTPRQAIDEFYQRDPEGNLDRIYTELMKNAPAVKQAEARVLQAKHDLAEAELNLRYCQIVSEIDGVVTRRNVNPGNNVQAGQGVMAVRSLTEIWIDANFKETQLADLRIGQRVEVEADMYGSRRTFEGRITGFTMGTGSTLALLPPQNATGNFVKVVQRLPVRIELTDYDPDRDPLFVGLSVIPSVYIKEPATGPDAGKRLQPHLTLPKPGAPPDDAEVGQ